MFFQVFYSPLFSLSIDYQYSITTTLQFVSIHITKENRLLQRKERIILTEISVRMARKSDSKRLSHMLSKCQWFTYKNLYSEAYVQQLILKYYNVERIEQEITTIDRSWNGYLLAELRGEIVGVIGGGMIDESNAEIYVFYIEPDEIGLGIGTRLLNFYTKIQKFTYGATQQWVSVAKGNMYGIPFYEAKGFLFEREEVAYGASEADQDISLVYFRKV